MAVGLENSRYYTLGCRQLYVATDHKPLLSILNDRALDTIVNPRLVRIKERTLPWVFDMVYVPGWRQAAADALSRRKNMSGLCALSAGAVRDDKTQLEQSMHDLMIAGLMKLSVNSVENSVEMITGIGCSRLLRRTRSWPD